MSDHPSTDDVPHGEEDAPESPLAALRRERVTWLLFALAIVDFPTLFGTDIVPDWVAVPLLVGQLALVGLWAGVAGSPLWMRMAAAGAAVSVYSTASLAKGLLKDQQTALVILGGPLLVCAAAITVLRSRGLRFVDADRPDDAAQPFQFSLANIMQVTACIAIILGVFLTRPARFDFRSSSVLKSFAFEAVLQGVLCVTLFLAVLSRGKSFKRWAAVGVAMLACIFRWNLEAIVTWPFAWSDFITGMILPWRSLTGLQWFVGQPTVVAVVVAGSLALLRPCGYHVAWLDEAEKAPGPPSLPPELPRQ